MKTKGILIYAVILADLLGGLAFAGFLYLLCNDGARDSYEPHALLVAVLGILVTVLIGWNIYQMIDLKEGQKQIAEMKGQLKDEVDKINNDMGRSSGQLYGLMAQMLAGRFLDDDRAFIKSQMILYAVTSLQKLSSIPDTEVEITSIARTFATALQLSEDCKLPFAYINERILDLGQIKLENRQRIEQWHDILELLEASKE